LISITGENDTVLPLSTPGAIGERQFAAAYLNETFSSREACGMRNRIIEGARGYLERTFYKEVEQIITKNPREAQLGGVPTITNKIKAYIRLRAARKDLAPEGTELQMVGQDYCWIIIFYLLRCGFVSEAAEYVSLDAGFRSLDYKFVTYMRAYAESRRLPRDLQQKINAEYQQRLRNAPENTVDPYRMACYKIIGRCDLGQRRLDGLGQGVEDWMWLQFALAREDNRAEEVAGDVFGLQDIQHDIREIGQRVFAKGQDAPGGYGTFFLLQIMGGLFEQAISYLMPFAPISAVHFAVALDYYGLLRVSDFQAAGEEILTYTTKELPQINFAQLVTEYTREFRTGYVEAAVDYFTLICLNSDLPGEIGKSHALVCHEALREFILETRDFAKLLGDIRSDGSRIKGAIEERLELIKFIDQQEFLKTITMQAAAVADDKGLMTDAVLLYHLAEDYDKVISVLNRTLSDAVAVDLGAMALKLQPLKPRISEEEKTAVPATPAAQGEPASSLSLITVDDPVALARNMIGLYNGNAMYYQKISQINRDSCGLLLRMMDAKQTIQAGKWAEGLDVSCRLRLVFTVPNKLTSDLLLQHINSLQILPLAARGSVSFIRSTSQAFSSLPPVISRNAGHLIMWSITCVARERERLAAAVYENEMRTMLAEELLVMAKDLMVFAGMIKYKLPPKVYETLARVGAEMGVL
jgi:nuclear pore complex protein Nup93